MDDKKFPSKVSLMFVSVKIKRDTHEALIRHQQKTGVMIWAFVDLAIKEKLAREIEYLTK